MKKRSLSIVALLVWGATQCFAQDANFNTTYGGLIQDKIGGTLGQYVANIDATQTISSNAYNTGYGRDAFGSFSRSFIGTNNIAYNTAVGYRSLYNISSGGGGNTAI